MSQSLKNYIDRLQIIMLSDTATLDSILSEITTLENDAYKDASLSNDDLLILYPATSVEKHSIKYLKDNYTC